jgi:membrane associated rhomboid family serine protease
MFYSGRKKRTIHDQGTPRRPPPDLQIYEIAMQTGSIICLFVALSATLSVLKRVRAGLPFFSYPSLALLTVIAGTVGSLVLLPRWSGFTALALWLSLVAVPEILHHRRTEQSTSGTGNGSTAGSLSFSIATGTIIALNVLAFLGELATGALSNRRQLYEIGAAYTPAILDGQWWRLLTAQFLHFDVLHLACNLVGLVSLGPFVEVTLGRLKFLFVYLLSGVGGLAAATAADLFLFHNSHSLLLGASAGVLGLVGAAAGIFGKVAIYGGSGLARKQLKAIGQILLLQMIFDFLVPQVSSTAHIGGAISGGLLGFMLFSPFGRGIRHP